MKKLLFLFILIGLFSCQKDTDNYIISIYGTTKCSNTTNLIKECEKLSLNFEFLDIDIPKYNSEFSELIIKHLWGPKHTVITIPIVKIQYNEKDYILEKPNIEEIKKLINK